MQTLRFEGRGGEYFRIWIVNVMLTIITLSIYYPWAKVRTRRYFHGNTTLEGRSFDYHATGRQLLPGYLISLLLLVIYIGVQTAFPVAALALFGILVLAIPWIVWKSLGFNLRMTSFSTVRFGFAGTVGGAYVSYLVWPALLLLGLLAGPFITGILGNSGLLDSVTATLLTIAVMVAGYALSFFLYAKVKQRRTVYAIDGYRYGQGRFETTVRTGGFARILGKTIGLSLMMLLGVLALLAGLALVTGAAGDLLDLAGSLDDPEAVAEVLGTGAIVMLIAMLYVGLLLLVFILIAYGYTRQRTYILSHAALDKAITFASTLGARRYAWVLLINLLLVGVTLGLAIPWARVRLARVLAEHTEVDTGAGFDDYMSTRQEEQTSLGEQLGDAFDVDVGTGF